MIELNQPFEWISTEKRRAVSAAYYFGLSYLHWKSWLGAVFAELLKATGT